MCTFAKKQTCPFPACRLARNSPCLGSYPPTEQSSEQYWTSPSRCWFQSRVPEDIPLSSGHQDDEDPPGPRNCSPRDICMFARIFSLSFSTTAYHRWKGHYGWQAISYPMPTQTYTPRTWEEVHIKVSLHKSATLTTYFLTIRLLDSCGRG